VLEERSQRHILSPAMKTLGSEGGTRQSARWKILGPLSIIRVIGKTQKTSTSTQKKSEVTKKFRGQGQEAFEIRESETAPCSAKLNRMSAYGRAGGRLRRIRKKILPI